MKSSFFRSFILSFFHLFILLFLVADSSMVYAQQKSTSWQLVFSDEFEGRNGSQPDTTKWSSYPREPVEWCRNVGDSRSTAFLRRGRLVCRAIPHTPTATDTTSWHTGAVTTKGKFEFQYGKIEVRLRTNSLPANFPAAWIFTPYSKNTHYGEVDIFETFGEGGATQTVHNHRSAMLKKAKSKQYISKIDVSQWHVYGLEWTPQRLLLTVDGQTVGVYDKSTDKTELSEGQWPFDKNYFIILNQSIRSRTGNLANRSKTYETEFDWIRVYQQQ